MRFSELEVGSRFLHEGSSYVKYNSTSAEHLASTLKPFEPGAEVDFVMVTEEAPDPANVLRASIGGTPAAGFYCITRANRAEVMAMLRKVLEALEHGH